MSLIEMYIYAIHQPQQSTTKRKENMNFSVRIKNFSVRSQQQTKTYVHMITDQCMFHKYLHIQY